MKLKIKYLENFVGKEINKKKEDSGYDLYASIKEEIVLKPMQIETISLGFSLEIVDGDTFEIQIRGRSGLNSRGIIATFGTIDNGYRGEFKTTIINLSGEDFIIKPGDRICQMVIAKTEHLEIEEVDQLSESERLARGFGSSGI